MCVLSGFSCVQLFATLWTRAHQASLSMGFSRQEYWSGLPCPPPGDVPDLGVEPASLTSPALAGRFFISSAIWEALTSLVYTTFSLLIPQSFSILFLFFIGITITEFALSLSFHLHSPRLADHHVSLIKYPLSF